MRGCSREGMRGCSGGHAWLLRGACVVAGGHACLLQGGHACLLWGVCVVAPGGHVWLLGWWGHAWLLGGMHGCSGGHAWLLQGACVVAPGGHTWLLWGACVVALGVACVGYDEIRRYDQ